MWLNAETIVGFAECTALPVIIYSLIGSLVSGDLDVACSGLMSRQTCRTDYNSLFDSEKQREKVSQANALLS